MINKIHNDNKQKSKMSFWSMWFGQFCYFSPNLKVFVSGSMWFHFCCHFGPKVKFDQNPQIKPPVFSFCSGVFSSFRLYYNPLSIKFNKNNILKAHSIISSSNQ
ncbi:hypothetical protein Hanom_Chr04g00366711 [Helianthus anomalus]